jgi:hypothetical protein
MGLMRYVAAQWLFLAGLTVAAKAGFEWSILYTVNPLDAIVAHF